MTKTKFKIGDSVKIAQSAEIEGYSSLAKKIRREAISSGRNYEIIDIIRDFGGSYYDLHGLPVFFYEEDLILADIDDGGL